MRIFGIIFALILFTIPQQANAGTLGCLLGAAGGGFGGAQIGKGTGQLAAVAAGTLLGCSLGSSIQNNDDQRRYQPTYQPRYQPQYGQRDYYINYYQPQYQRRVPYVAPSYPSYRYRQEPQAVYVRPQQHEHDGAIFTTRSRSQPSYLNYRYRSQRVIVVQPQQSVVQSNRYCREYQAPMITIGGKPAEGYGQACSYDGGKTWDLGPLQEVQ